MPSYSLESCVYIFKIVCGRGFKSQEEIDEYQKIKRDYRKHTGKTLFKLKEEL